MTTTAPPGYALDSAWHAERERLDSITRLYDPGTLEVCRALGVSDGWRCLDVGAGTGSLAQGLAGLTAPTGQAFGSFARSLTLPEGVDADAVQANFERGVLEIRIPKPEQRKPRKVTITADAGQ